MTRTIFCQKLGKEEEGLERLTYPGELGQRIYDNISKAAWQQWIDHQTRLINENRLNLMEAPARQFLKQEMEKFFFGEGSAHPAGYRPEK